MGTQISWPQLLILLSLILSGYYLIVLSLLYRKTLRKMFVGRWNFAAQQLIDGEDIESTDNDANQPSDGGNGHRHDDGRYLMEKLHTLVAGQFYSPADSYEFLTALKEAIKEAPVSGDPKVRDSVQRFLQNELQAQLRLKLTQEQEDELWN
ncbi:hypothetical protein GCM10027051_32450 [Niabella terrae]